MRRTLDELGEGDHCLLKADLQNSDEARRLVDHSVDVMDGIGIQVACAGAFEAHPIDTTILVHWRESFDRTLTVKLLAAAFATSGAACYMNDQGRSRIVNVSSRAAFRGEPGSPAYGAGKAGLNTFWLSLEQRLAPFGIFVWVVAHGIVKTDMTAPKLFCPDGAVIGHQSRLGFAASRDEVAYALLFLAPEGAEGSTGTIIVVNGEPRTGRRHRVGGIG